MGDALRNVVMAIVTLIVCGILIYAASVQWWVH
jgi:hypothetical protein